MTGRIVGALSTLVLLAIVGGGIGYVVATDRVEEPATFAEPQAVPAESPSFPVNVYDVEPDPDTAPLPTDVPLEEQRFRSDDFKLRAPVPVGWQRISIAGGVRWQFKDPATPSNTYLLRIEILAGTTQSTSVQAQSRIFALRQQEADGFAANLIIEEDDIVQGDPDTGFTYTEIDDGGYQRVGIERFIAVPGNSSAYYTVAVSGREADRDGMVSLVQRIVAGAYVP